MPTREREVRFQIFRTSASRPSCESLHLICPVLHAYTVPVDGPPPTPFTHLSSTKSRLLLAPALLRRGIVLGKPGPVVKLGGELDGRLEVEIVLVAPDAGGLLDGAGGLDKVRVERVLALDGLLLDPGPVPGAQVDVADDVEADDRARLRDIDGDGDEPPLPDERDVPPAREEGDHDARRVRRGQQVDEQEVVPLPAHRARRRDEQPDGRLLRVLELLGRVDEFPRVPILEQDGLKVGREDALEVAGTDAVKGRAVQAGVGGDAGEDLERVRRGKAARPPPGVFVVVEVLVQTVVARRHEAERLHGDLAAVQFVRVAEVDERVAEAADEAVHERVGAPEEELGDHGAPVVAVRDELVLEEVDKRALVLLAAEEVPPVVERDFRGRVPPGLVARVWTGGVIVDVVEM